MISTNPAFTVLASSGNQALAAAGLRLDQLKVGQIGAFAYETGLTIDGTKPQENKRFFLAMGTGPLAAGQANADVIKSSGRQIQVAGIKAYNLKPYAPAVDKVITLTFADKLPVNDEAGIKLQFMSQESYANYGVNNPKKTFIIPTGPEDAADSGKANLDAFLDNLVLEIAKDDEGIISATSTATTLVVTIKATALKATIPQINYQGNRGVDAFISVGENLYGVATVATTTELVYEQTAGVDVQQLEYVAGGWTGNPGIYRETEAAGFTPVIFNAVKTSGYDLTTITYDNTGIGGGEQYQTSLQTIIAVPVADDATATSLKAILDLIIFDEKPVLA